MQYSRWFSWSVWPTDVEPYDKSEDNSHNYLQLVLLKIEKTMKFAELLMLPMNILKMELDLHMETERMNLPYQEAVYSLKVHISLLENVMNITSPIQKKNCPVFPWFNQSRFISNTLSWSCHVFFNFLVFRLDEYWHREEYDYLWISWWWEIFVIM